MEDDTRPVNEGQYAYIRLRVQKTLTNRNQTLTKQRLTASCSRVSGPLEYLDGGLQIAVAETSESRVEGVGHEQICC